MGEPNKIVTFSSRHIYYQGQPMRMITMRDVSKVIQYEKLKVNSELTDMLTATISHDMRTPLNAIITVSKNIMHDL